MSESQTFVGERPLAFGGGDTGEDAIGIVERQREESVPSQRHDRIAFDFTPRQEPKGASWETDAGAIKNERSAACNHALDCDRAGQHKHSDARPANDAVDGIVCMRRHVPGSNNESDPDRCQAELFLRRMSEFQTIRHWTPNHPLLRTSSSRASR